MYITPAREPEKEPDQENKPMKESTSKVERAQKLRGIDGKFIGSTCKVERAQQLRDIDGKFIARQLEFPDASNLKCGKGPTEETFSLPVERVSTRKLKTRTEGGSLSEEAAEISSLKKQLQDKNYLLKKCTSKIEIILIQVEKLKKNLDEAKAQIANMNIKTAFAKNRRFIRLFSSCIEKLVHKKESDQKSNIIAEEISEHKEQGFKTPEKFMEEQSQGFSFEDLLAFVERKEKEENHLLSSELVLHNLNCTWNMPSGIKLTKEENPMPTFGTDEKVPPGPERIFNRKSVNDNIQVQKKTRKGSRKATGKRNKTVRSTSKPKVSQKPPKSRSKDARLGKRDPTAFEQLQQEIKELKEKKHKKLILNTKTPAEDRYLTNLTETTPHDLVFSMTDKKSLSQRKKSIGRIVRGKSSEKKSKKISPESENKKKE